MSLKGTLKKIDFVYTWFIRAKKNLVVPLPDGVSLRIDVVTPQGSGPWPVIITAFPYQKDGLGLGVAALEGYDLVKAGYAVVTADLRGHGASDGTNTGPFDGLRGEDLYELVEWCARQKWSNGKVGMEGESYGGMTALLAAAQNPPSLKAIYDFMAPATFYKNLVAPGGSMNMIGVYGAWLNFMNLTNLFPPLYTRKRPDWRAVWEKRLEAYTPYLVTTSEHVTYDDYWKKIDLPVEKIKVPTFIFEGWWDFARNDGFEIYDQVQGPKKFLVGPWVHIFPNFSPLEQIDYMHDMIRWFDYWMKDKDTGIMDEPPFSIYVMGTGFWKYEREWPPRRAVKKTYHLRSDGSLGAEADTQKKTLAYAHDPAVGTASGYMLVFPLGLDYPAEQSEDNARSLTFDTPALDEALEIVGQPELVLALSTDMPDAAVTAKLFDVAPDAKSTLITGGSLRLSRREGHENPRPPLGGKKYEMTLRLSQCDYQLAAGHVLRLALSLSDFPHLFPLPYRGSIELPFGGGSVQTLSLLTLSGEKEPAHRPEFLLPDMSFYEGRRKGSPPELFVKKDGEDGKTSVHGRVDYAIPALHLKKPLKIGISFEARIIEGKPESAVVEAEGRGESVLEGRTYLCTSRQIVTQQDADISVKITEDGQTIYERTELGWV